MAHVKNIMLSPRAAVKWIVRNRKEDAEKFVKDFNLSAKCTTPSQVESVYNDPEVNAVLICSPTNTHQPIIIQALNAEKAVFCEKPITADIETTKACYELAEKKKRPLFCAFHRRFDPGFREVWEKVRNKSLGKTRVIKTTSRDVQPPPLSYIKTSGGIIYDSTIHDLDLAMWLSGSMPKTVYVSGSAFDPDVAKCNDLDQVLVTIKFENGVNAVVDNGRVAVYGYDQRLEVLCDKGMLNVDNHLTSLVSYHGGQDTSVPRIDSHYSTRYPQAYANELEHFLDVLEGR
ncbi:hypothetical protein FSP39_001892 [Pinctada imbricata]|uniref:Uncharacterized protein n=1 Tax=Pinctada imbricata TaxID=66713 RepID=A0AA88XYR8_PINIB|nr:hypothetical protein FSP39_001892 [Pinctada imbricata]